MFNLEFLGEYIKYFPHTKGLAEVVINGKLTLLRFTSVCGEEELLLLSIK